MIVTATIRKCGSQWCLYTKDGSRLLGKHPTKEKALAQERAIKAHGAVIRVLDDVAEQLERRGAVAVAELVDRTVQQYDQLGEELNRSGFVGDVLTRDPDVAEEIFDQPIQFINQDEVIV
jgi:hypothetical protein